MISLILVPAFSALLIAILSFLLKSGTKKNPIILCQGYISHALEVVREQEISKKLLKKLDSLVNHACLQCYFVAIDDALEISPATKLLKDAREITASLYIAFPVIFDSLELREYLGNVSANLIKASDFIATTMDIPLAMLSKKSKNALSKQQRAKEFLNASKPK